MPRKDEKRKNSCPTNPKRLLFLLKHPLNEKLQVFTFISLEPAM
jgi:hypothetical protein